MKTRAIGKAMEKKVTYAEAILVDEIKGLKDLNRRILVAGNRSGGVAVAAMRRWPEAEVVAHAFDYHHARAIRKRLLDEGLPARNVRCSAGVGTVGTDPMPSVGTDPMPSVTADCQPFDAAFFMTTPQSMPAELVLDQLQDIHLNLAEGGALYAAFEGDPDEALKTMRLVWKNVNVLKRAKHAVLFRAVKRGAPVKTRDFAATWEASVPGGEPLTFTTYPGCFCHRRPDAGGLALAEVAAREVKGEWGKVKGEGGTGNGEWGTGNGRRCAPDLCPWLHFTTHPTNPPAGTVHLRKRTPRIRADHRLRHQGGVPRRAHRVASLSFPFHRGAAAGGGRERASGETRSAIPPPGGHQSRHRHGPLLRPQPPTRLRRRLRRGKPPLRNSKL